MSDDVNVEAMAKVLAGIISGHSVESIEKELLAKGLSQQEASELVDRVLVAKRAMGGHIQSLRIGQMQHPKGSVPHGGVYFEAPVTLGDLMLCSDRECPCSGQMTLEPGVSGYLYISKEVVEMRRDALTWEQLSTKVREMVKRTGAIVAFDGGVVQPIFLCEQGARRRNLDF